MTFQNNSADLHIHSTYSDGTDNPRSLADKVRAAGLSVFSVTDHDTVDFYKDPDVPSLYRGIRLITGIEFSCRTREGKCHILGYGMDVNHPALLEAIAMGRTIRERKLRTRLDYLDANHGITFDASELEHLSSLGSAGKPHIAALVVKKGFAADIGEAIKKYLSAIPGDGADRIGAEIAIAAINEAGGIPIWAHPLGGEGEKRLTDEALVSNMKLLSELGIKGVEYYYSRYSAVDRERIGDCIASLNLEDTLCFSGGSDYHGTVKNIPLGMLCSGGQSISTEALTLLKLPECKAFVQ